MANPTKRCPFKVDPDTKVGLVCENTNCMAFDTVNLSCKILEVIQAKISFKEGGFDASAVSSLINN